MRRLPAESLITPAEKLPDASLATIAFAVLLLVAVVALLLTLPAVLIVSSLVSAIEPASIVLVTDPVSPVVTTVPVTAGKVSVLAPATAAG